MAEPAGVLVLAHGAATSVEDLPRFYEHIREGAPTSPRVLAVLQERYRAIGGSSPLNATTSSLTAQLQIELDRRHGKGAYVTGVGFRHTPPYIEESLRQLLEQRPAQVLVLVMSPHLSRFAREGYGRALATIKSEVPVDMAGPWHLEPALIECWRRSVIAAWEEVSASQERRVKLLFTAHSVPRRWVEGDDLEGRLKEGGRAIARAAALAEESYEFAWQSASPTGEEWLGPDMNDVIRSEARRGTQAIVVCPHGFVADHLETLYDVDILARHLAEEQGMSLVRARMPNASPLLAEALADVVDRSVRPPSP